MSFLCSLEVEFLVKPWLCSTCQGSGLRGWIWNGTAAATIGILCQIFFRSSWGYWWWWLVYKKNDVQSPFQVWLEVLCRRAIGSHRAAPVQIMWSSLWITHVHFSNSDVPKLHWRGVRKNLFSVFDHFHLTPLWSIAEKYLLLAFVLSHHLEHTWLWLIFV